ncbi:vicilin-like seed storage protein At4g36700 [Rutidosis leptorrhynchoides]|uniref:vicilin-like seed storage protein At4g36700 n=1 Tax=Rutidosis leptorrhynchoides TaxID=125765 RepID=UPI003A992838
MRGNTSLSFFLVLSAYFVVPFFLNSPHAIATKALGEGGGDGGMMPVSGGPMVKRDERWQLVSTEFGEISAVKISDGSNNGYYHLHFITMNPCSLFLPVYLHSQMLLYVNSGSGTLNWFNVEKDDKLQQVPLKRGDIYTLTPESVFYIQNNVNQQNYGYEAQTLEIYAIFPNSETQLQKEQQFDAVYTGIHDLVLGFDNAVIQATLGVPEEVIEELRSRGEGQPLIVEGQTEESSSRWDVGSLEPRGIRAFLGAMNNDIINAENKKKKKEKTDNIFKAERDVETCFGWSVTVTSKELDVLKHTDYGVFMVNLRHGSMMGPHWNPETDQVTIVLQGQGVVEVVCPGIASETGCQNMRFNVQEGDVFVVPKSHPMAQLSFNDDSFVFMGFMTKLKNNEPQYLGGKSSILQKLDKKVLAKSFNVKDTTILEMILSDSREKIIYECTSCAEGGGGESGQGGSGCEPRQEDEEERGRRGDWKEGQGRGGQRGWEEGQGRAGQGGWQEGEGRGGKGGWQEGQRRGGQGWQEEQGGGGRRGWQVPNMGRGGAWGGGGVQVS